MVNSTTGPYLTPKNIAARYGVGVNKILSWIAAGELRAIDVSTRHKERPRWLIPQDALTAFETARSNAPAPLPTQRRSRKRETSAIQFFE